MDRRSFLIGSLGVVALTTSGCVTNKDTATTATSAASTGAAAKLDKVKAAWVYVGPINDGGWT